MKNFEIPKAVLDLLDYNLASDGMREQLEKDYVEMKTGVGSWKGDSVIVRTVQDDNKDLGMALLAAESGYTVLVAAPETVHSGADALLDSYGKKLTVLRGKNSMRDAMEKAKELLTDTRRTISDIAAEVGYQNKNYFTMLFKRNVGITPGKFRKEGPKGRSGERP